ncbi:MAG: apolipoprotein N-acyltransferase [Thermodesulfobacteriota bacterium]
MTKRYSAALLTGVLLILSFAPFGLWPLAWLAFVPLLLALDGASPVRAFFLAFLAGFTFFLGTVYWVVNSMHFYGGLGLATSVPVMLLLVAFLGVYPGLFGLFFRFRGSCPLKTLFFLPVLWTALEYLRSHLFTGFPWVNLGYSQVPFLTVIQVSDITGVWGLSFIIILVNALIFLHVRSFLKGNGVPVKETVITALLIIMVLTYGAFRIKGVAAAASKWKGVTVALAQGNIDQSVKWDAAYRKKTIEIYRALTRDAKVRGARFVVWPETAVPFYLGGDREKKESIMKIPVEAGVFLLTGSPAFEYNLEGGGVRLYNSAYLISPEGGQGKGKILGRYDKVHLVPYGEYVPLKRFFPFIKKLTAGVGDFSAGPGPLPLTFNDISVGTVICYEAIFPDLTRRFVKNGAGLLVNITNDAWFGRSSAPYQHFEMAALRAVENRVFLLRAANTGISAVVGPAGRVRKKSAIFTGALIVERVGVKKGPLTFYTRFGDIFAYICMAASVVFILTGFYGMRREGGGARREAGV